MHEARRRARAAAEKRKTLPANSGQKLGGAPVRRGVDIRKVIADAAQRRITVTKGCASGTERGRGIVEETNKHGTVTKAEDEDANEEAVMQAYIELIEEEERERCGEGYVPPSSTNPTGSMGKPTTSSSSSRPMPDKAELLALQAELDLSRSSSSASPLKGVADGSPSSFSSRQGTSSDLAIDVDALPGFSLLSAEPSSAPRSLFDSWSCDICTLSNPPTYLVCDACGTERTASTFTHAGSSPPLPIRKSTRQPQPPKPSAANPRNASSATISKIDRDARTAKAHEKLSSLAAVENKKPLGWLCHSCGTFMENQWWTCAGCGEMKLTS